MPQPSWHLKQCPGIYRESVNLMVRRTEAEWMGASKGGTQRAHVPSTGSRLWSSNKHWLNTTWFQSSCYILVTLTDELQEGKGRGVPGVPTQKGKVTGTISPGIVNGQGECRC